MPGRMQFFFALFAITFAYPLRETMPIKNLLILLTILALAPMTAQATLIYDNGSPVFIGVNITSARGADDFILGSAATITDVRFFGSVFSGTFPANFSGEIAWQIFNDAAGAIGTSVGSGSASGLSGVQVGSFYQVDLALGSPVSLGAGTYWLELHEGSTVSTNDGSTISWTGLNAVPASNAMISTNLANPPGTDLNFELAFQLHDNSQVSGVPEPSTWVLISAPLALLFWRRRNC
jgi:hypothetical protein